MVMLPLIRRRGFRIFCAEGTQSVHQHRRHPAGCGSTTAPTNHSPNFYLDETGLALGVRAMAQLAVDYLNQASTPQKASAL
jgi:metal-dependent amidase/aminoacylase/carboxypeptidase family protein